MAVKQSMAVLAALAAVTIASRAPVQAASGTAGRYHLAFQLTCHNTPQNAHACAVADNAQYPVFGKKGTTFTDHTSVDAAVDSRGKATFTFNEIITESGVPHAGPYCGVNIGTVEFNGSCRITQTGGKGYVAKGATGLNDFFATESTVTFYGKTPKSQHVKLTKGADTLAPAVAGHWNTAQYLGLLGIKSVPSGISLTLVVTRH
jgi:hypothetical protein